MVRAASSGTVPVLPLRKSYLLFLKNYDGTLRPTYIPLEIVDGRLQYPWPDQGAQYLTIPNPLHGLTLSDVSEQVRRVPRYPD